MRSLPMKGIALLALVLGALSLSACRHRDPAPTGTTYAPAYAPTTQPGTTTAPRPTTAPKSGAACGAGGKSCG